MSSKYHFFKGVEEKIMCGYGAGVKTVSREQKLLQLDARVRACTKCELHRKRKNAVPGMGVIDPLLMIVGEAPGASEDLQGNPFVGKAGQYLDKWLAAIELSRKKDVYITNVVKCRPPGNRTPQPIEVQTCSHYLSAQIQLIRPRFLLALGLPAANFLWKGVYKMGFLHGRIGEYEGIPLMATYHPSAVLRNPEQLRSKVWEDLQKLSQVLH